MRHVRRVLICVVGAAIGSWLVGLHVRDFRQVKMRAMTSVEVTLSAQAGVLIGSDDDVIQHFDLEQLTSSHQFAGHSDVGFTGGAIP